MSLNVSVYKMAKILFRSQILIPLGKILTRAPDRRYLSRAWGPYHVNLLGLGAIFFQILQFWGPLVVWYKTKFGCQNFGYRLW